MRLLRQFSVFALALFSALTLVACDGGGVSPSLTSIAANAASSSLYVSGPTTAVTVTGYYSDGRTTNLTGASTFVSSNNSVASVDAGGTVTAVSAGTAVITATNAGSGKTAATGLITVAPLPSVQSLAVTSSSAALEVDTTAQLTVIATYDNGPTQDLTTKATYTASTPGIVSISSAGVVTGLAPGTTTITAAAGGKTGTSTAITVSADMLQSIAVTAPAYALVVGAAATQLTVIGTYDHGPTQDLTSKATYLAKPSSVIGVSASGAVTAQAAGSATVTATVGGQSATSSAFTVSLPPPPTLQSISVATSATALVVGSTTAQLTVTGTFSDGSTQNLTSTSTFVPSSGVLTVSSAGVVTPIMAGTATITAKNGTATAKTVPISVTLSTPVLQSIAVTSASSSLTVGGATTQLTVTGTYNTGPTQNLTSSAAYTVNTAGVVSVSSAGVVTPAMAGATTITATVSGKTATTAIINVAAAVSAAGQVYVNGYATGVSFVAFGGAVNALSEDGSAAGLLPNGHKSIKFIVTGAANSYSGGAFVANAPQDLHTFNAVTFWAKASAANNLNVIGMGDDAASSFATTPYRAEINGTPLTTAWTQYTIPLPVPAKVTALQGLFHLAEANKNYTIWLGDIQYQNLPASGYVAPTAAVATMPATLSVAAANPTQINSYAPNTVTFVTPVIAGGKETQTGWGWYTFASTDATVATIDAAGFITGLKAGTENITASLGALPNLATTALTITVPLPTPTTTAPTPAVAAANVISMFGSTYPVHTVDTYQTSWSAGNSTLVNPYVINAHNVLQYTLNAFVGIAFGQGGPGTPVDASSMTTFHVDVWLANAPPRLQIQVVDFSSGSTISTYNANGLATGSWVSLEIPLSSFTPAVTGTSVQQILFISQDGSGGNVNNSVVYVDNMYFHK